MNEHMIAEIRICEEVPEMKENGISSGYMPHHKFAHCDYLVSGAHIYEDDEIHYPGETLIAKISFLSWEHFGGSVNVGDEFTVMELNRIVAKGKVIELL